MSPADANATSDAAPPRIASLLPSATEICFALGLGPQVVGVSHECDHPDAARALPALTRARIDARASSAEIDRQVRALAASASDALSIYEIERERMRALAPTLIVTQDTCEVCAVSRAEVERAAAELLGHACQVLSLSPLTLDDVLADIGRVGEAAGRAEAAAALVASLRQRLDALRARTRELPRPRVLVLEWIEPPMSAGHWTPELIRAAGAEPVAGHDGAPTRSEAWETLRQRAGDIDAVLVAACGFGVEQSVREIDAVRARFPALPVIVIDGNAYFNRPGPRLIDSAELAAQMLHPEHLPAPPPTRARCFPPLASA